MCKFPLYKVPPSIIKKRNNHRAHDEYLYRRWNNTTTNKHKTKTKKTRTKHQRLLTRSTTKDDTSVTPTLETLCTIDTNTPNQNGDANVLISITIWNKPIVQYRIPNPTNTRNRSREHTNQYCCPVCFDWCVRQTAQSSKSTLLVVSIS